MTSSISQIADLQTYTRTGTVVSCRMGLETHVHGSSTGGGGHIGPTGGHIEAPTVSVSSTTSERMHLFVQEEDGTEFDIQLTNPGVGVREGHRVSLLYAHGRTPDPWMIGALVNHTTKTSKVYTGRLKGLVSVPPPPLVSMVVKIASLGVLPVFALTVYLWFTGGLGILAFVGIWAALIVGGFLFLALVPNKDPALREEIAQVFHRKAAELVAQ
jgi:hypothetical protein